jgi:hypothetical protein
LSLALWSIAGKTPGMDVAGLIMQDTVCVSAINDTM